MVKKMTFKQFLFILPLLILLVFFYLSNCNILYVYIFCIIALMIRPQISFYLSERFKLESCSMRIVIISIIFWMMIRL